MAESIRAIASAVVLESLAAINIRSQEIYKERPTYYPSQYSVTDPFEEGNTSSKFNHIYRDLACQSQWEQAVVERIDQAFGYQLLRIPRR